VLVEVEARHASLHPVPSDVGDLVQRAGRAGELH
jgi:hypothetical protein